jgi:3-hydroxyisobutyrate dehydrogenase-like beta-hydroxyacid dehydrogenase
MATKLGFVGVGRMGGHMTSRLLDAGYELTLFDTSPEATKPAAARGAKVVGSPAEVASDAETVLICLPMPDIVRTVAIGERGVLQGSKVHTLIDLSTTGPTIAGIVARELATRKITLVLPMPIGSVSDD